MNATKYLWTILAIMIIVLAGCSGKKEAAEQNVVEQLPGEEQAAAEENTISVEDNRTKELEGLSTKEMIEKLMGESKTTTETTETTVTETNTTETADNSTASTETTAATPGVTEITIENMKSMPQNANIKLGDTVKWTSKQPNYRHIIYVRVLTEDGAHKPVAGPMAILNGESCEYAFNMTGTYDYYSSPCLKLTSCAVKGDIVVS
jgi:plastocyanin